MLQQFYVIDESGIGLFEYNRSGSENPVNIQLLSGFLIALLRFSEQILMDNVQTLNLKNGLMVITSYRGKNNNGPINYGVGFYAKEDHPYPAKKMNGILLEEFNKKFGTVKDKIVDKFDPTAFFRFENLRIPRYLPRNIKFLLIYPAIIGLIEILAVLYSPPLLSLLENLLKEGGYFTDRNYLIVAVFFYFPAFILGILSGTWWRAIISATVMTGIPQFVLIIKILLAGLTLNYAVFDMIGGATYFLAILGGYISQILFLSDK